MLTDVEEAGTGGGGGKGRGAVFSEWLRFNDLSISRSPLIPSRLLRRFFEGELLRVPWPAALPLSSEGRVTVLLIASPHLQSRLTLREADSSGMDMLRSSTTNDESGLLSISLSNTSCRWLKSCRPVEARHAKVGGLASGGLGPKLVATAAPADPETGVGGFDSSPASVIALSLPFFPSGIALMLNPLCIAGADTLEDGTGVVTVVPPPSSMRSSAHSHEMRYLELMV